MRHDHLLHLRGRRPRVTAACTQGGDAADLGIAGLITYVGELSGYFEDKFTDVVGDLLRALAEPPFEGHKKMEEE
ncbi:hypothetical protein ACWGA9_40775 [Streptomyces sp. NPDC054950]